MRGVREASLFLSIIVIANTEGVQLAAKIHSVLAFLVDVVMEQFHDEVHMGEDHSPTAVSLTSKLVQCIPT